MLVRIDTTGIDFFLDVQDKGLLYVIFFGSKNTSVLGERIMRLCGYLVALCQLGCTERDPGYETNSQASKEG